MLTRFGIKEVCNFSVLDRKTKEVLYYCDNATNNELKLNGKHQSFISTIAFLDLNHLLLFNKNNKIEESLNYKTIILNKFKSLFNNFSLRIENYLVDENTGIVHNVEINIDKVSIKPQFSIKTNSTKSSEYKIEFELKSPIEIKIHK